MSDGTAGILLVVIYRLAALVAGVLFAYFGYNLFRLGVYEKAGELEAKWKDYQLALRQAAPGTFFAVLGVVLIAVSLWRQGTMIEGSLVEQADSRAIHVPTNDKIAGVPQPIVKMLDGLVDKGYLEPNDLAQVNKFLNDRVRVGYVKEMTYSVKHFAPGVPIAALDKLVDGKKLDANDKKALLTWYVLVRSASDVDHEIKSMLVSILGDEELQKAQAMRLRDWVTAPPHAEKPAEKAAPAGPTATPEAPSASNAWPSFERRAESMIPALTACESLSTAM